jgi:hypothetical protein
MRQSGSQTPTDAAASTLSSVLVSPRNTTGSPFKRSGKNVISDLSLTIVLFCARVGVR